MEDNIKDSAEPVLRAVGRLEGSLESLTFMITRHMDMTVQWMRSEEEDKEKLHEEIASNYKELDGRLRGVEKKVYAFVLIGSGLWALTLLGIGWLLSRP